MWTGKLFGGLFGFFLTGGSLIGLIFGIFVGHYFDRGIRTSKSSGWVFGYGREEQHEIQQTFFKYTFMIMGNVAKSDGHVSESEILMARNLMEQMRLNQKQKQDAIRFFNIGKLPDFDLNEALDDLVETCHHQRILLQMFVEIQFQAASVDGIIGDKTRGILETICDKLDFSDKFANFTRAYSSGSNNGQSHKQQYQEQRQRYQHHKQRYQQQARPRNTLKDAYALLNITESATDSEVKKAYRKQMSQHHPDKLIAKGLPEEMIKLATDKTQKIQKAYENIRESRGLN